MSKASSKTIDMTQGPPLPLVLRFTLPVLLGNIFQQLYTVVDGIVVGKNVSDAAQAAVGASFSVTYMLTSLFLGIGLGGSVLVSQFFGQHSGGSIRKTIATMHSFLLVVSLPLTLFGILTAGPFLTLLQVPADYYGLARSYMCVYYLGLLPQFGYNANAGILQGLGDSRSPLIILVLSSILHILLDYAFHLAGLRDGLKHRSSLRIAENLCLQFLVIGQKLQKLPCQILLPGAGADAADASGADHTIF